MAIYSNVSIKVGSASAERPIEGSVSISVDEGNNEITKLKYEGGNVADIKVVADEEPTCTIEWKTYADSALGSASTTDNTTIQITTNEDSTGLSFTGIYIKSPSWDSQWGFVTQHKLIQT